jgi:hypothetical protein
MSRERLSSLLADLAEDVEPIQHHEHSRRAWTAARTRRQRRAMLGAAAAVVLVAVPVAVAQLDDPQPVRPGPSSTYAGGVRVDVLPSVMEVVTPAGWPSELSPPADAPTLTQKKVQRPVLAFQPDSTGPIYLYSELRTGDPGMSVGGWVRLDVPLVPTRDADGNEASPLDQNALAHAGEYLAFAQPDEYVIVEPATGEVRRFPLPGLNEDVVWLPGQDHKLLVFGDGRTILATPAGAIGPAGVTDFDVVATAGGTGDHPASIALRGDALWLYEFSALPRGPAGLAAITVNPDIELTLLTTHGWGFGDRIAQAATGRLGGRSSSFVMVVDASARAITHVLDTSAQGPRCCQVLGWLDEESVLIRDDEAVLAWHLPTGAVSVALPSAPGALSLAP